jgi:hypothetical protein
MSLRIRKLVGTILLLVTLVAYSWIMTSIAITVLPQANKWIELVYYMVAGLAWVVPAGFIIHWMHREPAKRDR